MRRVLIPTHIVPAAPVAGGELFTLAGQSMGTTWSVRLVERARTDAQCLQRWQQGIQGELDTVVMQMSHWLDDSDLGRFNRAGASAWQTLPEAFFEVLTYALGVAADSAGAYDPTAGALVNAWGFGPTGRHDLPGFQPPSAPAVETARSRGGWRRLQVDTRTRSICQPGGLLLDFSAVAKGYGVDRVAAYLERAGIASYLVEVGGELRGRGVKPDQLPWWVELERPLDFEPNGLMVSPPPTVVALHGLAVATSGDYRRCYRDGDRRLAHTIDPRTGYPIDNGVASVTVLHDSCMAADALSTALSVLGPDDGLAFAAERELAARFLVRGDSGFVERASPAFLAMLQ